MRRKYLCAKVAQSEKGVHCTQPTNLTIHLEIRWHKRICYDRLNGRLQCHAGDPVFLDPPASGHHTGLICGRFKCHLGSCRGDDRVSHKTAFLGSTHDFSSRLSPEVFFTCGYFRKTAGFEISVFPLLGELPKTIEPHLPICQLYRWQLGPNMWSSPTTKSFDPIEVTALRVGFNGKATNPPHVYLPAIVRSLRSGERRQIRNRSEKTFFNGRWSIMQK